MNIKILGSIFGLLLAVTGAVIAVEDRYAVESQVVNTITDLRLQIIADQLNEIQARESENTATEYDKSRKQRLELQWERYNK